MHVVILPMICQYKNRCYPVEFNAVDQEVPSILGLNFCTEINLIQRIDTIKNHHHTDLLDMYNDVFKGLGWITK